MKTPKLGWQKLGKVQMKGLKEPHAVFQLGRKTVDLEPRMEVKVKDWEKLKDAREELEERDSKTFSFNA
ncbi:hypothetical protein DYH11_02420 [Candidatus Microgenomates bacterium CPR3]|nr:hypothetical protein [Candidatus Microgenomates bacterium CPR3]